MDLSRAPSPAIIILLHILYYSTCGHIMDLVVAWSFSPLVEGAGTPD